MAKRVVTRLKGGTGNHLFQYAAGLALGQHMTASSLFAGAEDDLKLLQSLLGVEVP